MKLLPNFLCKQQIEPAREHTPRCLYADVTPREAKLSVCSVVSTSSMCSASDIPNIRSVRRPTSSIADSYRTQHFYCCRRSESTLLAEKYPDKVALIIEKFKSDKKLKNLEKRQYLLPPEATVAQLQHVIRNRVCDGNASLYIVVNGEMPALTETLGSLAKKYKDPDGFLYVNFSSEDTMG